MTTTGKPSAALPTTTANQIRCQVFQPTRRPVTLRKKEIATAWGTAIVEGRLGQGHADVLEAIMYNAIKFRLIDDRLQLLVDPHKIRMSAGGGKQCSYEQLWVVMKDLKKAVIELHIPKKRLKILGGIIDEVADSESTRVDPRTNKPRHLWCITLNKAWTELVGRDIPRYYDPLPIAKLTNGISQAVARHILTHDQPPKGGWKIKELLITVGATGRPWKRKAELLDDANILAEIDIKINGDRILAPNRPGKAPNCPDKAPNRPGSAPIRPELAGSSDYSDNQAGLTIPPD